MPTNVKDGKMNEREAYLQRIAELEASISEIEDSSSSAYEALGRAAYPALLDWKGPGSFLQELERVKTLEAGRAARSAELEETRAELDEFDKQESQRLENQVSGARIQVQTCPICGGKIMPEDNFCMGCGTKVSTMEFPVQRTCPRCHATVEEDMRFCPSCGKPLTD